MSELVLVDVRDNVAWLSLNRPDAANTINIPMAKAIESAASRVAEDDTLTAVVLTGAGNMFCAGGDIGAFGADVSQAGAVIRQITTSLHAGILTLFRMNKPLITFVNGPAAGAGLGLALLGDVAVASSRAHFTSAYTAIGMSPDAATSWLLPRVVGLRRAQEMILTNRRVTAIEAFEWGMVSALTDHENREAEVNRWLERLGTVPVPALAASRHLLWEADTSSIADHLEREADSIVALAAGQEGQTRIAAFLSR